MPIPRLTAIVLAKNEEMAIRACIESVRDLVQEVVVIDSESDDRTVEIAQEAGARVVDFRWARTYPKKKEWSLRNAGVATEWVLMLDADERVGKELRRELPQLTSTDVDVVAYDIPLSYFWRGRQLRHGQTVYKRSLLRPEAVAFPEVPDLDAPGITEVEGHYQPQTHGRVGRTKGELLHDDPDPVSDWFARHNRYSDWEAYLRVHPRARKAVRAHRSAQGQAFDRTPLKPLAIFAYNYLAKGGWMDGRIGFEYAVSLAFYQFQIGVKVRELREHGRVTPRGPR